MAEPSTRLERVRKAILCELADLIRTEVKDPRLDHQVISVTDVEITSDLRHAKVFISILADEDERNELMTILLESAGKLRKGLGQRVRLRYTPELHLKLDESLERGTRVHLLIEQISRGEL